MTDLVEVRWGDGPAPASVTNREAVARAIEDWIKARPMLPDAPGRMNPLRATMLEFADAALSVPIPPALSPPSKTSATIGSIGHTVTSHGSAPSYTTRQR